MRVDESQESRATDGGRGVEGGTHRGVMGVNFHLSPATRSQVSSEPRSTRGEVREHPRGSGCLSLLGRLSSSPGRLGAAQGALGGLGGRHESFFKPGPVRWLVRGSRSGVGVGER